MSILDHRKTWHFSVQANDEQCLHAFTQAMSRPGFKLLAAKWTVERGVAPEDGHLPGESRPACIATYQGRGGVVGILTAVIGGQAHREEQAAIGSRVIFAVSPEASNGHTACSMWISDWKVSTFGFVADARFIRSSMREVEKHLRVLDPMMYVEKG